MSNQAEGFWELVNNHSQKVSKIGRLKARMAEIRHRNLVNKFRKNMSNAYH